jgi:hypothetical protein
MLVEMCLSPPFWAFYVNPAREPAFQINPRRYFIFSTTRPRVLPVLVELSVTPRPKGVAIDFDSGGSLP